MFKIRAGSKLYDSAMMYTFCHIDYFYLMVLIIKRRDIHYSVCSSYTHRDAFFINFHNTLHLWRIIFA